MTAARFPKRSLILCFVAAFAAVAFAQTQTQTPAKPFEPTVGQAGKDVVWVPSPQVLVDKMLDMAKVTPQDVVMDLGSGDGRTVITAAKRGATAIGVEYNPDMAKHANGQRGNRSCRCGVANRLGQRSPLIMTLFDDTPACRVTNVMINAGGESAVRRPDDVVERTELP